MARVLVADDEPHIRKQLEAACRLEGHDVVEAVDAHTTVALYEREPPDLLVLDLKIPGGGGAEVVKRLRFAHAGGICPVMIVSGHLEGLTPGERRQIRAEAYVDKPINLPVIRQRVREILGSGGVPTDPEPPPTAPLRG